MIMIMIKKIINLFFLNDNENENENENDNDNENDNNNKKYLV